MGWTELVAQTLRRAKRGPVRLLAEKLTVCAVGTLRQLLARLPITDDGKLLVLAARKVGGADLHVPQVLVPAAE